VTGVGGGAPGVGEVELLMAVGGERNDPTSEEKDGFRGGCGGAQRGGLLH
jgi:hypothetical protein